MPRQNRQSTGSRHLVVPVGSALVLIGLIGTAGAWVYLQAPIVSYALTGPNSYVVASDANGVIQLQIQVRAKNTGPTTIEINVKLSAVNATLSQSRSGPYSINLTDAYLVVDARSDWGNFPSIYVMINKAVSAFAISIVGIEGYPVVSVNPSWFSSTVTSIVVSAATYIPIRPQTLQYIANPLTGTYDLVQ